MQFTHEIMVTANASSHSVWASWNDPHALPRLLSHVRAVATIGDADDLARFVILLDHRHWEFAAERTMCDEGRALCWQSTGELFLYVLSLHLAPNSTGETQLTLTVAYDPPGFLPDIAESLGRSRKFKRELEADLNRYIHTLTKIAEVSPIYGAEMNSASCGAG